LKLFPIHGVLNITLKDDILLEKLMGRRTCINCGTGFNICNIQRYIFFFFFFRDGYSMDPLLPKK
jgi:adenylate kinase